MLPLLLNLLLLTRQSAEHGAVEPKQNELPSFRERWGLSIVPKKFQHSFHPYFLLVSTRSTLTTLVILVSILSYL
jgi:hypothetical protein